MCGWSWTKHAIETPAWLKIWSPKLPISTQLRPTWHTESLDMVVLPCTGASCYHSCWMDGGTSPEYLGYHRIHSSAVPYTISKTVYCTTTFSTFNYNLKSCTYYKSQHIYKIWYCSLSLNETSSMIQNWCLHQLNSLSNGMCFLITLFANTLSCTVTFFMFRTGSCTYVHLWCCLHCWLYTRNSLTERPATLSHSCPKTWRPYTHWALHVLFLQASMQQSSLNSDLILSAP
jgi:hypothetical protein